MSPPKAPAFAPWAAAPDTRPMERFIVAITGASGVVYGARLIEAIARAGGEVACVVSGAAREILRDEVGWELAGDGTARAATIAAACDVDPARITCYRNRDGYAPIASGSHRWRAMVVAPCSMATLAAIAHGMADNLIRRAADVTLKEGRRLILVPRESPLSLIHLENLVAVARAGAQIIPPIPHFYARPQTVEEVVAQTVARVMDHFGLDHDLTPRWEGRKTT